MIPLGTNRELEGMAVFETIGAPELLIIGLIVIVLFGAGKVGKVGKELGTSVKEFRRAVRDEEDAPPQPAVTAPSPQPQYTVAQPGQAALPPAATQSSEPLRGPQLF